MGSVRSFFLSQIAGFNGLSEYERQMQMAVQTTRCATRFSLHEPRQRWNGHRAEELMRG